MEKLTWKHDETPSLNSMKNKQESEPSEQDRDSELWAFSCEDFPQRFVNKLAMHKYYFH